MMDHFKTELDSLLSRWSDESDALVQMRNHAFDRFAELGFPTKKWEDWQFTDFSLFKKVPFRMTEARDLVTIGGLENKLLKDCYSIIIINGHYQPDLTQLPEGVQVRTLLDVFLKNELPQLSNGNPFVDLNTSFMNSGLAMDIDDNVQLDQPIHYLFITTGIDDSIMNHPRLIINVGKNSSAIVIEHYLSENTHLYWNNCVSISNQKPNSKLDHIRIQEDTGYHTDNMICILQRDAQLRSTLFNHQTQLYRGYIHVEFHGENGHANLNGLSLLHDSNHMDTRVIIDHEFPHCNSDQFFKYILNDTSSGVFNGRIIVREDSQKTDSNQSNKNLLLSENATMHSNPQLEIYADDVRCTHGSTTGQLSEDVLYYLRTRGIEQRAAQKLIVKGFAREVFSNVKHEPTADYLNEQLNEWLAHG